MSAAHRRMLATGLLVIVASACSTDLVRESSSRGDSLATTILRSQMYGGPTGGHVDFCYGFNDACEVLAHLAEGSPGQFESCPGPNTQLEPITFVFPRGATNLLVRLQGGLPCTGEHGTVSAFDAAGAHFGDFPMAIDDPSDCGEDDQTGRFSAYIETPRPVAKVVVSAPSPLSYPLPEIFRIHNGLPPGLIVYGQGLLNFSFDWTATPPRSLEVSLARDEMLPLLVRRSFDALLQTHFLVKDRSAVHEPRLDTVTVKVKVTQAANGSPVAGAQVRLRAEPIDSSGGHIHTTTIERPAGSFYLPGENSQASGLGDHPAEVTLTTSSTGEVKIIYRSSGLGGKERIIATLISEGATTPPDTATLTLRVPGLVKMDSAVANRYAFKPQNTADATQRHGNNNRWIQAAFRNSVNLIFRDYFENGGEITDPDSDDRFFITDVGLEFGELYDVRADGEWSSPHMTHRRGLDMDIRSRTIPVDFHQVLQEACLGTKKVPRKRVVRCTFESTGPAHLHIEGFAP